MPLPKPAQRQAVAASELTDDEVAWVMAAEIPTEHRYSLKDVRAAE
jgi:hypothetical protein